MNAVENNILLRKIYIINYIYLDRDKFLGRIIMNRTSIFFLALIIASFTYNPLIAHSWNIFIYMDSSDDLSDMAIKNITDMMRGNPNDSIELLIQVHAYYNAGLRYRISNNNLHFIEEVNLSGNPFNDFINAAQWAFKNDDAEHTMLILSNHGWGILDPIWNTESEQWESVHNASNNSCPIEGPCSIKRSFVQQLEEHKNHRGFMFNDNAHQYLTNKKLIKSLAFITQNILNGKKIDILAFDTCMGAMVEIAYQCAPYAHYLVGNQSCSLRDGFNYEPIISFINSNPSPAQLAAQMVKAFDSYYTKNDVSGVYTHAAVDLSVVNQVREKFDAVLTLLLEIPEIKPILEQACNRAPRFCMWPMYTDMVAFIKLVEEQLPLEYYDDHLKKAFNDFYETVSHMAVAHCGGFKSRNNAYGLSIYLPYNVIDSSYYKTTFAQDSQWLNLLQFMGQIN